MGFRKPESALYLSCGVGLRVAYLSLWRAKLAFMSMLVCIPFSRSSKYPYSYSGFQSKKGKKEGGSFKD